MFLRQTPDETAIDEVFAAFFSTECSPERVRSASTLGFDSDAWARLAETGAPAMACPEEVGGGGSDLRTLGLAVAHLGRTIAPVPLIEHAVAVRLLAAAGASAELLEPLVDGSTVATLCLQPGDSERLVGAGAVAGMVVGAVDGQIVASARDAPVEALANVADLPLAYRSVGGGTVIGADGGHFVRAQSEWKALMATALAGMAAEALRLGVDYAKEREQFGVKIGTFQAVQHGLATSSTNVEGAQLLAARALWALDADQPDAHSLASMALIFCAEAAQLASATSLQYHGGYGYAEEYDIQLYYRRAKGWPQQMSSSTVELATLADLVLPGGK